MKPCRIEGCGRPLVARTLCGMHYQRWSKSGGDPLAVKRPNGGKAAGPPPVERTCRKCGFTGATDLFGRAANICLPCKSAYASEWKRNNRDKVAASNLRCAAQSARRDLRRRARVNGDQDPDFIEAYYAAHDGKCEICGGTSGKRALSIDHDHATNAFRGLLCNNCNNGLGRFRDSIEYMQSAIAYLQRSPVSPGDLLDLLAVV